MKTVIKARHRYSISEVKNYFVKNGTERALNFFYAFFQYDFDFKTENKIVRAMITNDLALLENTISDIQNEQKKVLLQSIKN